MLKKSAWYGYIYFYGKRKTLLNRFKLNVTIESQINSHEPKWNFPI